MPGYVKKALTRFDRTHIKGANSPIIYVPPTRGPTQHIAHIPNADDTPLDAAQKTWVQEVVGVFLFYSRAIDSTMLTALNKISTQQSAPSKQTLVEVERFLQYAKQYPESSVTITASKMQLHAHSDASYQSESQARSRAAGIIYLGDGPSSKICGIVDIFSVIIPTVCSAVAEAEYAALFLTGHAATSIRHTLLDLGYPQGPTTIICDNTCAVGIANNTC